MAKAKKTTVRRTSMTDFLTAYVAGKSYADIAKTLGLKETTVIQRVYKYRKQGINIAPKATKRRGSPKLDVNKANELIANLSK